MGHMEKYKLTFDICILLLLYVTHLEYIILID